MKITPELKARVLALRAEGKFIKTIQLETGLSHGSVCTIVNGTSESKRKNGKLDRSHLRIVTPKLLATIRQLLADGHKKVDICKTIGIGQTALRKALNEG